VPRANTTPYAPVFAVAALATLTPRWRKMSAAPDAGALQGTPSRHTGVIGLLLTVPRMPFGVEAAPPHDPTASAMVETASAIAIRMTRQ